MRIKRVCGLGLVILWLVGLMVTCGAPLGPRIEVEDVWARPAMAVPTSGSTGHGMASTAAVFMRLANQGKKADRFVGGQTEVAQAVEIHEVVMEGDVANMRMLSAGLEIPPRGQVLLEPGGYHVMLVHLNRDLVAGDKFTLHLHFEKSAAITVEAEVREP